MDSAQSFTDPPVKLLLTPGALSDRAPVTKFSPIESGARIAGKGPGASCLAPGNHRNGRSVLCEINSHCGALEILVTLGNTEPATQYELRRRVPSGYCAFAGSLKCLESLGLIRSERADVFPFRVRYQLTENGRMLATALIDWERRVRDCQGLSCQLTREDASRSEPQPNESIESQ